MCTSGVGNGDTRNWFEAPVSLNGAHHPPVTTSSPRQALASDPQTVALRTNRFD